MTDPLTETVNGGTYILGCVLSPETNGGAVYGIAYRGRNSLTFSFMLIF